MSEQATSEGKDVKKWYVLVFNLPRPETVLPLATGISLRPLNAPLTIFDLAAAGAVGFREWAILEPFARGFSCEIETDVDAAKLPGYDALNRAWLISAMLMLRGFTAQSCIACSSYSWDLVAGCQERSSKRMRERLNGGSNAAVVDDSERDLPRFRGNVLDYHLRLFVGAPPRADNVSQEDVLWIQTNFDKLNRLASGSNSFRLALEAATDWRFSKEERSAVARLWSGIEAIFGINSELVYRISLLSASLLESRGDARKARFEAVKNLYGLRSKVVHGAPLSSEKIGAAMVDSYNLLRDLLLLSIDKGHALGSRDFDEALFF